MKRLSREGSGKLFDLEASDPIGLWLHDNPAYAIWAVLGFLILILSLLTAFKRCRKGNLDRRADWICCLAFTTISLFAALKSLGAPDRSTYMVINVAVASVAICTFTFHVMAFRLASTLTTWWGLGWIKYIDYFYLGVSTLGVVKLALSGLTADGHVSFWNTRAVILIAIALALRFTKTTIEIRKWDVPKQP